MHFTFASAEALSAFSFTLSLSLSVLLNLLWSAVEEGRREEEGVLWLLSGFIADLQPRRSQ